MKMKQFLECEYALSNRIKCATCHVVIFKNELKIGHIFLRKDEGQQFDKKIWYHLHCIKKWPTGERGQELPLFRLQTLKAEDQQKIKELYRSLQDKPKNKKEIKILSKQEQYEKYVTVKNLNDPGQIEEDDDCIML
ncbi:unnamed protein product [Paramecium primaurelia]|uniref:PARP-type domain-containing protein n=1 Tax=Paramecium primaurelia TaxID=5886 RepID=A0A8S1QC79_PARPR|nr:unnamed protein product [Paramecium primaurelia]